jgi:hypothetical protein
MFTIKDHKTRHLFDPWQHLGPKRRQLLDESWAGFFQQHLLPELPVSNIAHRFHASMGRPSKELGTVLGALLLQQWQDLTDEETIEQLAFNIQWHYALNIPEESDRLKYICLKTLWTMRQHMTEADIDQQIFDNICDKLARLFDIDTRYQRIDSVHIQSNMRRLGRISIFSSTMHKFLVNLRHHHKQLLQTVSATIRQRYLKQSNLNCFAQVKPSQAAKTLKQVAEDLLELVQQFKNNETVVAMHSYKLMRRVLEEQCQLSDDGQKVSVKPAKQISSDSLQNPSDPDASYSGHKGQGYQLQLMETYTPSDDDSQKAQSPNLITHVQVEKACRGDSHALMPAIEAVKEKNLAPKQVAADSLYGSDDNYHQAKSHGVELVAPVMGAEKADRLGLSDFVFANSGKALSCPAGHAPQVTKRKKTRWSAGFDLSVCNKCPLAVDCPAKAGKSHSFLRYEQKAARVASRRRQEKLANFIEKYRWRAGVEGSMSQLDRRTGVKRMRYRGFEKVRFAAILKAAGINILRATAAFKARRAANRPDHLGSKGLLTPFLSFKEQLTVKIHSVGRIFQSCLAAADAYDPWSARLAA